MKVLHTSDWHIGRTLYGRKRYQEFESFLGWLRDMIQAQSIDALVVAGDIFDTNTPSNRAQQLYYQFLHDVAQSPCRHVVVVAGNHDSPTFLSAPRELLRVLDVHVVGSPGATPEEDVLVLRDASGSPELIVCAIPYLRDRDIRVAEPGETLADKERKLVEGVRKHYADRAACAEQKCADLGGGIPVLATGHLFTAGGQTIDGDGVRDLYVGSLAHVTAAIFPDVFDYVALGHLHVPQKVNGAENIRYSGSPIPMGFGEAKQQKSACLVEFDDKKPSVELIDVPLFQRLERVRGDWDAISDTVGGLASAGVAAWMEIVYDGQEVITNLRARLEMLTAETDLEILRVKNNRVFDRVMNQAAESETLDDLDVYQVFERCLVDHSIPEEQWPALREAYRETVVTLQETDGNAE